MSAGAQLIDTHCHIHDDSFEDRFGSKDPDIQIAEAIEQGVSTLVCIGSTSYSSKRAITFCEQREQCFSTIALHPHQAEHRSLEQLDAEMAELDALAARKPDRLVAIGECGLDYYYHHDPEDIARQKYLFIQHIELAKKYSLPLSLHIRDAFDDFFAIYDEHADGLPAVVHSFSATEIELKGALERGLYIGLNGIMTFTKDERQLAAAKAAPLERIVVETDAPFLTPSPHRGKMCEPKHVVLTAQFLSELRGESFDEFAQQTTHNARKLFGL